MVWSVKVLCSCCRTTKKLDKTVKKKDLLCECGGHFRPVVYFYDIEVAMQGGPGYINEELEYRANYKPLDGLDQWVVGGRIVQHKDDPECTCDEEEEACPHCIGQYTELSGD